MKKYDQFLMEPSYYEDLYDRHTVEKCLRTEKVALDNIQKDEKIEDVLRVVDFMHYIEKGERYANREVTIHNWIRRDRDRQNRWDNTPTPKASCKLCKQEMEFMMKMFHSHDYKLESEILRFTYGCKECSFIFHLYENGTSEEVHNWQCPQCKREVKRSSSTKGRVIKSHKTCICGYSNTTELDLDKVTEIDEIPPLFDEKDLPKLKERFCLNEKDGMEYLEAKQNLEKLKEVLDKDDNEC